MKIIALMIAILLLKAAKCIAYASEFLGDCALWIIDQCDPDSQRKAS
ncbi:hypothetical protein GB928_018760 [Shinella curvata]|uniref:Uncharacterized protein n=1 Tax=Shinella curvata TaxID=1817964 RepID=A0ABT8XHL3_9HYPH|nr:hypothetical protein [Shinella curvata]MCJ8053902.1 hypothetical protein [Shinella curvata]MDO6123234.1 hypothetical protein [Shinella curvata]